MDKRYDWYQLKLFIERATGIEMGNLILLVARLKPELSTRRKR